MNGKPPPGAPARSAANFRWKLQLAMMLVVAAITALVLLAAQQNAEEANRQRFQIMFESSFDGVLERQNVRHDLVEERCRSIARNMHFRAALGDEDVKDLYDSAQGELRDVIRKIEPAEQPLATRSLQANFCRFLNAKGVVLPPPPEISLAPWEKDLAAAALPNDEQQIGFAIAPGSDGAMIPNEIFATPIIDANTGDKLGTLILGYDPSSLKPTHSKSSMKSGIWFDGRLTMPALAPATVPAVSQLLRENLRSAAVSETQANLEFDGEPQLVFAKILNPGSHFAPAYQICIYPVGEAIAAWHKLQWQIVSAGLLVLLAGLAASHLISRRLARPVEQLAVDSADHLAKREEAEAALVVTEKNYRSIFENAVEGIFLLSADGSLLSVNPAFARIFGYESPAGALEKGGPKAFRADPALATEFLRRVLAEGVVSNFECQALRRDDLLIWITLNGRAIAGPDGAILHLEGTVEDITERKQTANTLVALNIDLEKAVSDLRATQQQVVQQERLRALGQMASGIAHDFNNALMPIIGFSELLLARPEILGDGKKAGKYLDIIHTGAKDAANIVGRLREFYRANEQSDVFGAVDLNHLVEQVVTLTQPKWKDQAQADGTQINVQTDLQARLFARGEESALREVLTNLVFNAVDAMPNGGVITLRARTETNAAVLEVADTGTGMTPDVRKRCLEPFFSTKGARGTGLGLAMVFGILQRHEGTIDIESQLGKGSVFIVRLPLQETQAKSEKCENSAAEKPMRVLVVDDEPQVRDVLAAFLTADGHSVATASNGLEGLRAFRQSPCELVVTDKAMPGMSGDQMALAIKQFAPETPIVLLTGFSQFLETDTIPGIDVLATKPISMPNLRAAIRKAVKTA
ncbi:MAG TPA: ATP-binding protein [Chthoniobacteraceae bacterium]